MVSTYTSLVITASLIVGSYGFSMTSPRGFTQTKMQMVQSEVSRDDFFKQVIGATAASAFSSAFAPIASAEETVNLPSGVKYDVIKTGDGPSPKVGEMAAIRFRANVEGSSNSLDDIFETPEPYYTRVGSGGLIKGVEEVIPKMRVGDRFVITVPGKLAFGPKGRPASAGKPRIPNDATIVFEIEMVGLPGREVELIELIGDE